MSITHPTCTPDQGFPLICFVCETDADLLPHFVRWYRRLGVTRFELIMHGNWSRESLNMLASLPGVECNRWVTKSFCRSLKCDTITAVARRYVGQWVVFADADEFLELPTEGLRQTTAALEAAGIEELYASLVQRIAADGSLPRVLPDSDIDAVFPMYSVSLCEDMGLKQPAWRSKYPLVKVTPGYTYKRGGHLPGNDRSVAHVPIRAAMHHFKWRDRLLLAFSKERGEGTNSDEMTVYRGYIEEHGRLPTQAAKPASKEQYFNEGLLRLPTADEQRVLSKMIGERLAAVKRRPRVGFVTFELAGPGTPNGGIATAMSSLAKLQAAHGHDVDVFFCPFHMPSKLSNIWYDYWSSFGVKLHHIPRDPSHNRVVEWRGTLAAIVERVRDAGHFDALHFCDTQGFCGAFAMLKAAGLEFGDTNLAITTHGGTRWHNEFNNTPWDRASYLQELIGQRLCDLVVSPSAYLIEWNRRLDALPARHVVLPNVLDPESKSFTRPLEHPVRPECLAFFGRVEIRKGIDLFLAALRELATRSDLRPDVLILGRFGTGHFQERFDEETAGLPFRIEHYKSLNPQEALRMLKERRALAIMPSRQENSPYVAYEAMENQLPFLVSFTGGTAELVRREDWPQAELPPDPGDMADKFATILREGLRPARLAIDPLEVELRNLVMWREFALQKPSHTAPRPLAQVAQMPLREWRTLRQLPPSQVVALVPDDVPVRGQDLAAMARLLAASRGIDIVQPVCGVSETVGGEELISSVLPEKKVTARDAAVITGPLPLVLRASAVGDIPDFADPDSDAETYTKLMTALDEAGKDVLPLPLKVHSRQLPQDVETRAVCARYNLCIGRSSVTPRPMRAREAVYQRCGMLSDTPFVAISMLDEDLEFAALSLHPDEFARVPSLHLMTVNSSLRWVARSSIPRRISDAKRRWPMAHFRVLAADENDLLALRAAGLQGFIGNINMFMDESVFHPFREEAKHQTMDAIYIAAMSLRENHHLTRNLDSVGFVHHRFEGMDDVGEEIRRIVPQAVYLTDSKDRPEGFFYPGDRQVANWICQASTGLALNEVGDSCVATARYLLCGTPVVTVRNTGGRDYFLDERYAIYVDPTPESVAAAVREFKSRNIPREEIHEATKQRFIAARRRFVEDVNSAMREVFGPGHAIDDISGLVGQACRYRPAIEALRSPQPFPTAAADAQSTEARPVEAPPPMSEQSSSGDPDDAPPQGGDSDGTGQQKRQVVASLRRPRFRWLSWLSPRGDN